MCRPACGWRLWHIILKLRYWHTPTLICMPRIASHVVWLPTALPRSDLQRRTTATTNPPNRAAQVGIQSFLCRDFFSLLFAGFLLSRCKSPLLPQASTSFFDETPQVSCILKVLNGLFIKKISVLFG